MARRKHGRDIDGVLLLDKPHGLSSNRALQRVRKALDARKAGHTGSLDPLATGLLPICLGEATKLSSHLLAADKQYRVTAHIGAETTTGDAEGEISRTSDAAIPQDGDLRRLLASFVGAQEQMPPMYSALKVDGKPLYQYARAGQTIARAPRPITIYALDRVAADKDCLTLDLTVSSGTYVRTVIEDLARTWGGCAHVIELRRTRVGALGRAAPLVGLEQLESAVSESAQAVFGWLHPLSALLADWPRVTLNMIQEARIRQGQSIEGPWAPCDRLFRVYSPEGGLLGLGYCEKAGWLRPKRLFTRPQR